MHPNPQEAARPLLLGDPLALRVVSLSRRPKNCTSRQMPAGVCCCPGPRGLARLLEPCTGKHGDVSPLPRKNTDVYQGLVRRKGAPSFLLIALIVSVRIYGTTSVQMVTSPFLPFKLLLCTKNLGEVSNQGFDSLSQM